MKRVIYLAAAAACIAGFAGTLYVIFYKAPVDRLLLFNQKIFYYHVANAFMLFAAVITCGVASLLYLRKRQGRHDDLARSAAELAVLFGAVALISGAIWGKAAWDIWWDWDARLTTTLLLWMTMLGYVLVRQYGGPGSERMAAGLAVFATANIPLVYFSVKIWRTLHPQTSVVPELQGWMRIAMWSSVALFAVLYVIALMARIRVAQGERRLSELREQALDAGIIE
ncbi:MAG TPA: cytochrome c biogenesis protein CcsA [Kofleriaceae bacterium]|nr:cytochrome c biogenesis protein CcsA [Kofleriaceae bacterium]